MPITNDGKQICDGCGKNIDEQLGGYLCPRCGKLYCSECEIEHPLKTITLNEKTGAIWDVCADCVLAWERARAQKTGKATLDGYF